MSRRHAPDHGAPRDRLAAGGAARVVLASAVLALSGGALAGAERVFPLTIHAGVSTPLAGAKDDGLVPDAPFRADLGYGYVGGTVGSLPDGVPVAGERPQWPRTWREGIERIVVRVPRGAYLVELSLLETDVALAGMRVFDVFAEEEELFSGIDCAAVAGDFAWLTLRGIVPVYDGWLDLRFAGRTSAHAPRISRVRITRSEPSFSPAERLASPERPVATGGPSRITLRWERPAWPAVAGYGVFRAAGAGGAFRSLTDVPLPVPWYEDRDVVPGERHRYKVRAYSLHGGQSGDSDIVECAATTLEDLGIDVYELRVAAVDARTLALRPRGAAGAEQVPARLFFRGEAQEVFLAAEAGDEWGRKKSYRVTVDREENRSFRDRSSLLLSAAVGDETLMRDLLAARLAEESGLAAPLVAPVAVVLNGEYLGLYHDVEVIDERFVRRTRLDRFGLLAAFREGRFHSPVGWQAVGDKIGKNGAVIDLNLFAHELRHVGEDEIASYFADRLYLDRFLTRMASGVAIGERSTELRGLHALEDSRNGRWEFFRQRVSRAAWGAGDVKGADEDEDEELARDDAAALLYAGALQAGDPLANDFAWLWSRFLNVPSLRLAYLQRLRELLHGPLAAERVGEVADALAAQIAPAALGDPLLALVPDLERGFREASDRLRERHRQRAARLEQVLAMEGAGSPGSFGPLVLSEVAGGDGPWVELENTGAEAVELSRYGLRAGTGDERLATLPGGALAPGERRVVPRPRAAVAILALLERRGGDHAPRVRDLVVHPAQPPGSSLARVAGTWTLVGAPTPGEANAGETVVRPPYGYRQGVAARSGESFTIWLQAGWTPGTGEAQAASCEIHYRGAQDAEWRSVPLGWNDTLYRHEVSLEASASRDRLAYYFRVTAPSGAGRVYPLPAPDATYSLAVPPELVINEVLPRPDRERGTEEFIEIFNASETAVDLGGYYLSDRRGNPTRWRIPEGTSIGPRGFAVFYTDSLDRPDRTNFRLSNSGEFLGLFGRLEEGNLLIDGIAFRGMRPGESWGRTHDGARGFRVWKDPTPGKKNLPKITEELLRPKSPSSSPP